MTISLEAGFIIMGAMLIFFLIAAILHDRSKRKDKELEIKMKERVIMEKYVERGGELPHKEKYGEIDYGRH